MNVGLITEYNPFHNGHLIHLQNSKNIYNAKHVVVVMSGNFVQRGEPAICDKYTRTKMALLNGADIVIELPVHYATSSAAYFADAAISLLDKSNIVDYVCFGSESGDIKQLEQIADILADESNDYKQKLKISLDKGNSYAVARSKAIESFIGNNVQILNNPNNILGIEYIKALKRLHSAIKPVTIERQISQYHQLYIDNKIASATAIRLAIKNNNEIDVLKTMPKCSFELLQNDTYNYIDNFSFLLHYILKQKTNKQLSNIQDLTEGLENRILKSSEQNFKISDMIDNVKTKRFARTKISRAIMHILLDLSKKDFEKYNIYGGPQYIRVLGFKKQSVGLLHDLTNKAALPVIMNLKYADKQLDKLAFNMLKKEIATTDIYNTVLTSSHNKPVEKNYEYSIPIVIV